MPQPETPFVIAHRGASAHAPENTLSAFRLAAEQGATWIETDANITRDSAVVMHHDDTLERCSNGQGHLINTPLASVQGLDFGSWFSDDFQGEGIPTLETLLALCESLNLGLNLEIKCTNGWERTTGEVVSHALKACWNNRVPLILSSFSLYALESAKQIVPEIPRSYLCEVIPNDWRERLAYADCTGMHCADLPFLRAQQIAEINAAGFPVRCYTVNDPKRAEQLQQMGVSSVFTDYPDRYLKA